MNCRQRAGIGDVSRNGRIAWGVGALVLLVALGASIPMSSGALSRAEQEAERWARDQALGVVTAGVAPGTVANDVSGGDYRKLLVRVQAGILAEGQATVVRIWRVDGNLIFSTAQRDDVAQVSLPDDPWIERAAGGEVVSTFAEESNSTLGLKRPNERLYQTFVPLQPSGASVVMGVVEIDQPYASIHDPALRLWRLLQLILGVALVGVALGFVQAVRQEARAGSRSAPARGAESGAADGHDPKRERSRSGPWNGPRRVREPVRPHEEAQAVPGPDVRAAESRLEELDLRARAAEAEREQHLAELERLRDALEEKEAELAIAREGATTRADARRERKVLAEAHKRAAEAERKSVQAEDRSEDAAKRAMEASTRTLEIEAQLRAAEETITTLRRELADRPEHPQGTEVPPSWADPAEAWRAHAAPMWDQTDAAGDREPARTRDQEPTPDWSPEPSGSADPTPEPALPSDDENDQETGGLSLRERLARAAAARHHGALS